VRGDERRCWPRAPRAALENVGGPRQPAGRAPPPASRPPPLPTASGGGGSPPPPAPIAGLLSKLDVGASLISGAGRGARDKLAGGLEAVLGALLDNDLGDNSFLKPAGVFGEY